MTVTLHEFTFYSNIFLLVYWHLQNDTKLHEWNEFRRRRCYCRVITIQLNPIKSPVRFDSHCTSIGSFHHRLLADTSALLSMEFGGVASVIKASVRPDASSAVRTSQAPQRWYQPHYALPCDLAQCDCCYASIRVYSNCWASQRRRLSAFDWILLWL